MFYATKHPGSVSYWVGIGNHFPAVKLPRREISYFHTCLITRLRIRGRHDRDKFTRKLATGPCFTFYILLHR